MPAPLSNPFTGGQINDIRKNGLVSWHKGAQVNMAKIQGIRSLFWEKGAAEYTEEHSSFDESGFGSKTGDGEDYKLTQDTQGDTQNFTQQKRTARKKITEDLLEFSKYPEVDRKLRAVGGKLWRGYALDLAHRFTFAFDTTYDDRDGEAVATTGGDAAALCADTHTLNSGDSFDNKITARLSEGASESAEDLFDAVINHNGDLVHPSADTLVTGTHAATRHVAMRLTKQPMQLDTDFNNISVYAGELRHVVVPYLATTADGAKNTAKSRFWFLIDSSLKDNLMSVVRRFPNPERPTVDPDNNSVQFKAKMWYDIGHLDATFIVGSNAT